VRLKLDENLPASLSALLAQAGHDVSTVLGEALGGAPDDQVAAACLQEQRVLVTLDRGFGDPRRHPPGSHAGIIVLRLADQSTPAIERVVRRLVRLCEQEEPAGRLWIVGEHRVRIRG
jgi:predicted nuclease of predicted toxin-antitoxin system